MNGKLKILLYLFIALCLALVVLFSVPGLISVGDERADRLLGETVTRSAAAAALAALLLLAGMAKTFAPAWRGRDLLWSIPCFLVAAVNFPFSALINGSAQIVRADLLWLFLLKCLSIALLEELFFRALLLPFLREKFAKHALTLSVLLSSALFALMHLFNLFFGAGVGATFLQVGYTFLIGCMLSVTFFKTENVYLCVLVHMLFDVGGIIVTDLGTGPFQDAVFWILTAIAGVLCTVHILRTVIGWEKN